VADDVSATGGQATADGRAGGRDRQNGHLAARNSRMRDGGRPPDGRRRQNSGSRVARNPNLALIPCYLLGKITKESQQQNESSVRVYICCSSGHMGLEYMGLNNYNQNIKYFTSLGWLFN